MKTRPGFVEGVGVALVLSSVGAAVFAMFHPFFTAGFLVRLLLSGIGFAYVVYLLWRSRERIGRVTVIVVWMLASVVIWLFYPPIPLFMVLQLVLIWLIRSLYFYSGVLPALLDLGLNGVAALFAIGAGLHTQSLFVALWCFFLSQALFVFIPATLQRKQAMAGSGEAGEDRFERAHRVAMAAVRKLSSV